MEKVYKNWKFYYMEEDRFMLRILLVGIIFKVYNGWFVIFSIFWCNLDLRDWYLSVKIFKSILMRLWIEIWIKLYL